MGIARRIGPMEFCPQHQGMKTRGHIEDQERTEVSLKVALVIATLNLLLLAYVLLSDQPF